MYLLLLTGFITDFLATFCLFILCIIAVLGTKYFIILIKEYLPKNKISIPKKSKKPLQPQKKVAKANSNEVKPIRSIEIDPTQVDRIYVKKSS